MSPIQMNLEQLREWKRWFDKLSFTEKVEGSREMSIGERMSLGPRLFDVECEEAKDEIRTQIPEFSEQQVETELRRRLVEQRRIEEEGIYQDAGIIGEDD